MTFTFTLPHPTIRTLFNLVEKKTILLLTSGVRLIWICIFFNCTNNGWVVTTCKIVISTQTRRKNGRSCLRESNIKVRYIWRRYTTNIHIQLRRSFLNLLNVIPTLYLVGLLPRSSQVILHTNHWKIAIWLSSFYFMYSIYGEGEIVYICWKVTKSYQEN